MDVKESTPKREKKVKSDTYNVSKQFTYKGKLYKKNASFSGSVEEVDKLKKYLQ